MLEFIYYVMIWFIVGDLCIDKLNKTYDDQSDWDEMSTLARVGITTIAPVIYSGVRTYELYSSVFKK